MLGYNCLQNLVYKCNHSLAASRTLKWYLHNSTNISTTLVPPPATIEEPAPPVPSRSPGKG